jgi:hypothetical protein
VLEPLEQPANAESNLLQDSGVFTSSNAACPILSYTLSAGSDNFDF